MKKQWKARKISLGNVIIATSISLVIGIGVGANWQNAKDNILPYLGFSRPTSTSTDWAPLGDLYSVLSSYYDGDIDKDLALEGAKRGLVKSLKDDYTVYMDKQEVSDFTDSLHGKVGAGIGIELGLRDNYVRVIRTLPDNPARKAGILAGDIIYSVNDEKVLDLTTEKIAQKIRGEAGTKVKISVVRNSEELTFELDREEINNVSADVEYLDDGHTALIRVTRFDNDTGLLVEKFAPEFKQKSVNKIILDLRSNGGGYVSAARDLLSLWIDGEKILTQKSKHSGDENTYAHRGKAVFSDIKTVVLVNGSTASASEITAGALKDYKKATIIGEKTYGKGVVQQIVDLNNGASLKVTVARWYTPNGTSINKTGIKPDKKVVNTFDDINANRDPQLDAAKKIK